MWVWSCKRYVLSFSSDQKTNQVINILVKCRSPTAETPVRVKKEETCLISIWMIGDCLVERLSLEIVLKYESCSRSWFRLQGASVVWSYIENCFIERGDQRFISFLEVCWVCWRH